MKNHSRGFTLLELIIVIGILAILGTVSVLVLNPAELFRQTRDSSRIQDIGNISAALSQYISNISSFDLNGSTYADSECASGAGGKAYVYSTPTTQSFVNRGGGHQTIASRAVNGTGWVPVKFDDMASPPISNLPIDPLNTGDLIYRYACDQSSGTFELNASLESQKYTVGGNEKIASDGGDNANFFEMGTDPGLDL